MRRRQRPVAEASLSFLDVISCGFGAIVLLMLIAKTVDSTALEEGLSMDGKVRELQNALFEIRGETSELNRELKSTEEQLSEVRDRIARLQARLAEVEKQQPREAQVDNTEKAELTLALQILTEEMERLLGPTFRTDSDLVGGIPVDSEYLVFIIDTSGSMLNYAWPKVQEQMVNILNTYPKVKGIQILNDQGDYMFSTYRRKWVPDSPSRRKIILRTLANWTPFSNSSPVEGIEQAIRDFYDPQKKISLFVFGDDFSGRSIREVVKTVDRLNRERGSGERLVRIHTIGFPVHFVAPGGSSHSAIRFANLMRELSYRNGGTFVGLNELR
jgi:hypothetical protein